MPNRFKKNTKHRNITLTPEEIQLYSNTVRNIGADHSNTIWESQKKDDGVIEVDNNDKSRTIARDDAREVKEFEKTQTGDSDS